MRYDIRTPSDCLLQGEASKEGHEAVYAEVKNTAEKVLRVIGILLLRLGVMLGLLCLKTLLDTETGNCRSRPPCDTTDERFL